MHSMQMKLVRCHPSLIFLERLLLFKIFNPEMLGMEDSFSGGTYSDDFWSKIDDPQDPNYFLGICFQF